MSGSCLILVQEWIIPNILDYITLKGYLGWGSHTPILTSYLKSAGFFTPGVKFSSKSVQPLQRYCNLQTRSKEGMENLYLGNPSYLMT